MDLSNYFEKIGPIAFDNSFSTNLNDVLTDIDENFQRIVAAPFFQGPAGKNVKRISIDLYDNRNTGEFSLFGKQFILQVFGTLKSPTTWASIVTYSDLVTYFDRIDVMEYVYKEDLITKIYVCDIIDPDTNRTDTLTSIDCYCLEDTTPQEGAFLGLTWFQDRRIEYLSLPVNATPQIQNNWHDYSCAVYGTLSSAVWSMKRYEILPIIYWSNNVSSFCWQLNGIKTDITCQGVKGDKGDKPNIWVVKGTQYTGASQLTEQSYVCVDEILFCTDPSLSSPVDIQVGDLVYAWFIINSNQVPKPLFEIPWQGVPTNFSLGTADIYENNSSNKYITYDSATDILAIVNGIDLRTALNSIHYDYNDNSGLNMLFVPNLAGGTEILGMSSDTSDPTQFHIGVLENNTMIDSDDEPENANWVNDVTGGNIAIHSGITKTIGFIKIDESDGSNPYVSIGSSGKEMKALLNNIVEFQDSNTTNLVRMKKRLVTSDWPRIIPVDDNVVKGERSISVSFNPEMILNGQTLYIPYPCISYTINYPDVLSTDSSHFIDQHGGNIILINKKQLKDTEGNSYAKIVWDADNSKWTIEDGNGQDPDNTRTIMLYNENYNFCCICTITIDDPATALSTSSGPKFYISLSRLLTYSINKTFKFNSARINFEVVKDSVTNIPCPKPIEKNIIGTLYIDGFCWYEKSGQSRHYSIFTTPVVTWQQNEECPVPYIYRAWEEYLTTIDDNGDPITNKLYDRNLLDTYKYTTTIPSIPVSGTQGSHGNNCPLTIQIINDGLYDETQPNIQLSF